MIINLRTKPCPFCGGKFHAHLCDDEGNPKEEEYLEDPWSGLSYMVIHDSTTGANEDCPMFRLYGCYYDSIESAEEWLNKRCKLTPLDPLDDRPMGGFKDI